jgi:hypothetical protein
MHEPNPKLTAALHYQKMGLSIFPVGTDKVPLVSWKEFQTRQPTAEEIMAWWKNFPEANPAVVTGKISGIVVVDIDAKHNRTPEDLGGEIPPTAVSRTGGGGWHIFFKYPHQHIKNTGGQIFGAGIDIRGDGGYAILPPSSHASGGTYSWEKPFERGAIAEMPDWLLQKIVNAKPDNKPASRDDIFAGVSEGMRNDSAAHFTGHFLRKLHENEWNTIGWAALKGWNSSNNPPLEEKELRTVFESIATKEHAKITHPSEPKEAIQTKNIGESISFKELCEQDVPPVVWAIDKLFEVGTINMVSAAPNQYKSWVVLHMAICLASGNPVFGQFKTQQQPVMIINEEDHIAMLKNRLRLLTTTKDLPIYFYVQKEIKLADEFVAQIIQETERTGATFIVFDSLRAVHSADENSSKEMQVMMEHLKKFMRKGMTVLVTHHNRKKTRGGFGGSDNLGGEEMRGSSSILAAIHGLLSLENEKDKKIVIHQEKLKCAEKQKPFIVRIEEETSPVSLTTTAMRFIYEGTHSPQNSTTQLGVAILKILEKKNTWMSKKDLFACKIEGATEDNISKTMQALEKKGDVESMPRGKLEKSKQVALSGKGASNEKFFRRTDQTQEEAAQQEFDNF